MKAVVIPINDPQWIERIHNDPCAMIFHHPEWVGLFSRCYGCKSMVFSIQSDDGTLQAGIPLASMKRPLSTRRWIALPFSDYCTPLADDDHSRQNLLHSLADQALMHSIKRVEIRWSAGFPPYQQESGQFVHHSIPLEPDPVNVAGRVHRQQMQNVLRAQKDGIRIQHGTSLADMRTFYRLHTITRRKHGIPVQPWIFFTSLQRILENGLGFILLAYYNNQCISAGLFLHWGKTLTYKYSATDPRSYSLRPNHLITWTAIQWGCENTFTTFDFGRSDVEDKGLRSFKCRWGAIETPLVYSYLPSIPKLSYSKSEKSRSLMNNFIQHTPLWVTRTTGELLYRFLE